MDKKKVNYPKNNNNHGHQKTEEKCTGCMKTGHTHETCYFIHGFPEGHPLHGKKFIRKDCNDYLKKVEKSTNYHATTEETKGNELTIRQNLPD